MTYQPGSEAWLRTALSKINDGMRGEQSPEALCKAILLHVAEHIGANIGTFYLADGRVFLRRAAIFAYAVTGPEQLTFGPGEGLIGQAAVQKKMIVLDDLPADYIKVKSSFGETSVRQLVVLPVMFDDRLNGVMEFGALTPFSSGALDLLTSISENVGIAIDLATSRQRLREVLAESERLNEELQTQQEELKAANEEMSEQARALSEAQVKLEGQQAVLEESNAELESKEQLLEEQKEVLEGANLALRDSKRELESASRYKSEFLSNMSHELRTPLNSILIIAQLLEANKSGRLTEEDVDLARTILGAGNDLLTLINDILDLAKIESGKVDLNPAPVALSTVVSHLEKAARLSADRKNLRFRVVVDEQAVKEITTDRQRLEQVLKNFLSNAMKFTQEGEVQMHVWRADSARLPVAISVSDTGIGIPREKQTLVFEAFKQADGTTARKFGGTGLGLSISRELARLLQGEIGLESKLGEGSTFTIFLPERLDVAEPIRREDRKVTANRPGRPLSRTGSKSEASEEAGLDKAFEAKTRSEKFRDDRDTLASGDRCLLVIEDESQFAQILARQARDLGFKCLLSEDGETGLADARKFQPNGILLDLKLPGMSGIEVLEQLKRDPQVRHIPVHVISGADSRKTALHLGAIGYLMKPVSTEMLKDVFGKIETAGSKSFRKILIVEDDERQLGIMQNVVTDIQSVETVGVRSGEEALIKLREGGFDCMVLDLRLPGMSGYELLKTMADDDSLSHPPVIVYTGAKLSRGEEEQIRHYTDSIIIKGARSPERLLDETMLFLHRIESDLPAPKQKLLRELRDRDQILDDAKILLVDDDMRNVFALSRVLQETGAKVVVARNGQEALDHLDKQPDCALVLMDIMMPIMDGFEAMREIRKQGRFAKLPIIALTAKAMKGDQEECFAAGASDYLPKPIDVKRLLSLVRVWLAPGAL